MTQFARKAAFLAAVFWWSTMPHAASANPVGQWTADGLGFAIEFDVGPRGSDGLFAVTGMMSASPTAANCPLGGEHSLTTACEHFTTGSPVPVSGHLNPVASGVPEFVDSYSLRIEGEDIGRLDFGLHLFSGGDNRLEYRTTADPNATDGITVPIMRTASSSSENQGQPSRLPAHDARPTDSQTGIEIPGLWTIDGTGMIFDIVVEPGASANAYPIYVVASRPQDGQVNCGADIGAVIERLCEIVDKDGPVLLWGDVSRVDSGHLDNTIPAAGAQFSGHLTSEPFGEAGVQVGFAIRSGDPYGTLTLSNYAASTGPTQTVRLPVRKLDEKFTPSSGWADGNWRAEFRGLDVEAALSAEGPLSVGGTVQFVPGVGTQGIFSGKLGNFVRVVEDFGPFHMTIAAELGQVEAFFEGYGETDRAVYTAIYQDARYWLLPLENDVMIVRLDDYDGNPDSPFLLQRSGPITPLATLPRTTPQPRPQTSGTQVAPEICSAEGTWQAGHGGTYFLFLDEDAGLLPLELVVAEGLIATITMPGRTHTNTAFTENTGFGTAVLRIADALGSLSGLTASAWFGSVGEHVHTIAAHNINDNPSLIFVAGCERGVLLTNGAGPDVAGDLMTFGPVPRGTQLYFLERTSIASGLGGGAGHTGQDGSAFSGSQLGEPASITGAGAAALVLGADMSDPCPALMGLEDALWAGAADGSVVLDDLRALTQLLYAAGVRNTGMANEAECRNILVMLQAEMAQRTAQ